MQVRTWQQAEVNARDWMRSCGFADAKLTKAGADGGLDIRSSRAVAQVKFEVKQTGRPQLQNLVGARGRETESAMLFFTSSGYTKQAVLYADDMGIALFHYSASGKINPLNKHARQIASKQGAGAAMGCGLLLVLGALVLASAITAGIGNPVNYTASGLFAGLMVALLAVTAFGIGIALIVRGAMSNSRSADAEISTRSEG